METKNCIETEKRLKKNYMWNRIKQSNVYGISLRGDKIGQKEIFEERMAKHFFNLIKIINPKIQEAQQTQSRINIKKTMKVTL